MTKILLFLVYEPPCEGKRGRGAGQTRGGRVSRRGTLDENKKVKSCSSAKPPRPRLGARAVSWSKQHITHFSLTRSLER